MKTIQATEHGAADVLKLIETEIPQPKPGQALVKIHYAGVNFIDVAREHPKCVKILFVIASVMK